MSDVVRGRTVIEAELWKRSTVLPSTVVARTIERLLVAGERDRLDVAELTITVQRDAHGCVLVELEGATL